MYYRKHFSDRKIRAPRYPVGRNETHGLSRIDRREDTCRAEGKQNGVRTVFALEIEKHGVGQQIVVKPCRRDIRQAEHLFSALVDA